MEQKEEEEEGVGRGIGVKCFILNTEQVIPSANEGGFSIYKLSHIKYENGIQKIYLTPVKITPSSKKRINIE